MKQSFLLYECDSGCILNYISSPYVNHVKPIIMNRKDEVIGINCFDEFLYFRDFIAYIKQAYPN